MHYLKLEVRDLVVRYARDILAVADRLFAEGIVLGSELAELLPGRPVATERIIKPSPAVTGITKTPAEPEGK